MKLILLSLVVLTIAFVNSAHVSFVATDIPHNLSDEGNYLDLDDEDCRANEVWRECGHAAICDGTCENNNELYLTCPPVCVRRCICEFGFVRNDNGYCIRPEECQN